MLSVLRHIYNSAHLTVTRTAIQLPPASTSQRLPLLISHRQNMTQATVTRDTTSQSDLKKMKHEPDGSFKRPASSYRDWIKKGGKFEPEKGASTMCYNNSSRMACSMFLQTAITFMPLTAVVRFSPFEIISYFTVHVASVD